MTATTVADLSLEQAPPIDLPLRFFLTAPLFVIAAALLLFDQAEAILATRWSPATLGALGLALGFLDRQSWVLGLGALSSALGFGLLALGALAALGKKNPHQPFLWPLLALLITVVLGLILTAAVLGWLPLPPRLAWVDWHARWGLFGWVGLLILTVSLAVAPLFYVTPAYPRGLVRWGVPVLVPAWWLDAPTSWLGLWLLAGVGIGLPSGMLMKILPFLFWFHLQSRQLSCGRLDIRVPHMHRLLPERLARVQAGGQCAALILLLGSGLSVMLAPAVAVVLTRAAAVLFALTQLGLLTLLGGAVWRYRQVARQLSA